MERLELPVGFRRFHRNRFINYQCNRLHALGFVRTEEVAAAAAGIRTLPDHARAFGDLSAAAERSGRLASAAFYARAAEMFTPPARKGQAYDRFIGLFDDAFADVAMTSHAVPFDGGVLPARVLPARVDRRGTVVLFGGFDSIIEEFFAIWWLLAEAGFDVVAFDGPGQGGARSKYGVLSTHDWERPVAAVLDHLALDDVALVGLSMGGYWAIRAAAHEARIRRVVAWPPVHDWLDRVPAPLHGPVRAMLRRERFMDASVRVRTRLSPVLRHAIDQALYISGGSEPMDAVRWFLGMNGRHVGSSQVAQDVALMGGEHDRFQAPTLLEHQAAALTAARSVTTRIFTAAEHADQHCQMGNIPLATQWLVSWLGGAGDR